MTATTINPAITVGELVRQRPSRARIFEQFKIDYCCGGKIPLSEACSAQRLDLDEVVRRIEESDGQTAEFVDADAMSLTELADHIEQTHHAYLKEELPRLDFLTNKVATVHGEAEPRLITIRQTFVAYQQELMSHMMKEEQVLFPMIRQLDQSNGPVSFHCGSLANPIHMMEHEHENAGDALAKFRELTDDYTPPEWACNTFRAMYNALSVMEPDMHQHVHKENSVLFPKALAREAELNGAGGQ